MHFIDDDEIQFGVNPRNVQAVVDKVGLEGLWSNEQYSTGRFAELAFFCCRGRAMPTVNRNFHIFAMSEGEYVSQRESSQKR